MTVFEYTETVAPEGDAEGRVLETLAEGMPYAFIVATSLEPLTLRVASAHDTGVIRALLVQTLNALPSEDEGGAPSAGRLSAGKRRPGAGSCSTSSGPTG